MFANSQMSGMNFAFPDVCNTPTPVGPVPIPYPNTTMNPTGVPFVPNVFYMCAPSQNMLTQPPMSMGDNGGVAGGLVSGMDMGPTVPLVGAFTVLVGGVPATRMTTVTGQNGMMPNMVGATIVPSQVRVLMLR